MDNPPPTPLCLVPEASYLNPTRGDARVRTILHPDGWARSTEGSLAVVNDANSVVVADRVALLLVAQRHYYEDAFEQNLIAPPKADAGDCLEWVGLGQLQRAQLRQVGTYLGESPYT